MNRPYALRSILAQANRQRACFTVTAREKVRALRMGILSIVPLVASISLAVEKSEWPSGSAMGVGGEHVNELKSYENSMTSTIGRIGKLLKEDCEWCDDSGDGYRDLLKNIRANHAAWRTYAKAECELLYKLEGPPWNTWASTRFTKCEAGQALARLQQLRRVERCLKSDNKNKKPYYFQECLFQLAPLSLR